MIYLDNTTITRPSNEAVSAMLPFLTERWGNPSAPHQRGQQLFPAIQEHTRALYSLIGADDRDTVLFTSSGAEAVSHLFFSTYSDTTLSRGKNQFVVCRTDEAPSLMALRKLEQLGCVGKWMEVETSGRTSAKLLGDVLTPRTALVSLSWGNGLTGVIQPVVEIAALCKERGISLHLDATHVLGKIYFDLEEIAPDFVTFNGDHLHAPSGTGVLYMRQGHRLSSLIAGGMDQAGMRGGSLNMAALAALSTASKQTLEARDFICTEVARLRHRLESKVLEGYSEAVCFFQKQERLPHISCIGFPGISNEALLFLLNRQGVLASMGGGSFQQIGLVLMASGIEEGIAHSALTFALSRETTESEIDRAAEIIVSCAKQLRKMSLQLTQNTPK